MNVQSLNAIKCSFDCPALCLPWGWSGVVNFVHPLRAAHASPSLREGEEKGVLCFSLGSRVRGNDGVVRGNDGGGDSGNDPCVLRIPFAPRRGRALFFSETG